MTSYLPYGTDSFYDTTTEDYEDRYLGYNTDDMGPYGREPEYEDGDQHDYEVTEEYREFNNPPYELNMEYDMMPPPPMKRCFYCQRPGHVRRHCRSECQDLAAVMGVDHRIIHQYTWDRLHQDYEEWKVFRKELDIMHEEA